MALFQNRVRKKVVGGYTYYTIIVPAWLNEEGVRKWEYFSTKAEAMARAVQLNAALLSREKARVLTAAQEEDARRAFELLRDLGLDGVSLRQAVEVAAPVLRSGAERVRLGAFLADFAAEKSASWRAASKKNFHYASAMLLEEFGQDTPLSALVAADLGRWLVARFPSASYRAHTFRTLAPAFNWGVRRGILERSPFDGVERPRLTRQAIDVLTPEEAERAMRCCPPDCVAAVALMLFGGVRPGEVARLTWGDVRADFVHLRPGVTKTAQVRNVEVTATLGAWLGVSCKGTEDQAVVPGDWKRKSQAWRRVAGLARRQDVLRHSYATYHLAMWRDEAALRENMGHSRGSDVLFRHYRAAATPAEAEAFWSILPTRKKL